MHALKIMVGAAAALTVGVAGAQAMHESPRMSGSAEPWAVGEAWGGDFGTTSDAQGAHGRAFSQSSSPAERPLLPTPSNEAYDGTAIEPSADVSSGAQGRAFGEPGLTREEVMARIDPAGPDTAAGSLRLNQYAGGD